MHVIRLRKPWHAQWYPSGVQLPVGTVAGSTSSNQAPSSCILHRTACYRRSFNRPTGLIPGQVVAIVVRDVVMEVVKEEVGAEVKDEVVVVKTVRSRRGASGHIGCIKLNSQLLALNHMEDRIEAEIGQQLEPFNQLEIFCQLPESTAAEPPELTEFMEISIEIY